MTLAILLPSRGRPQSLARFIKATGDTADDWHIFVRVDDDDPALPEYEEAFDNCGWDGSVSVYFGDRVGFGASLNELAHEAALGNDMSHMGMFGDDVLPVSPHWDTRLVSSLGERLGVAYGDDGLRKKHAKDLPTHYVTQTEVYRRLGYLAPPAIRHLFLDNVAKDIGRYLQNFQYVPVELRHLHPWAEGEHLHDSTYAEGGRNSNLRMHDKMAYTRWSQDRTWKEALTC